MLLRLAGLLLFVYVLVCLLVYAWQRALIYFPTPVATSAVGEPVIESVVGAQLRLWVVRRPGPAAAIYFGGNAESVVDNAAEFAAADPDRTWVFVNYRGYGGSTGEPTESALVADALRVFDAVRRTHPEVSVVGRSLGTGVAVQLAAARPVHRLVLVTPFDDLVSVGREHLWWLPLSLLAKDRFESVRFAPRIHCPVQVLVADNDEVIHPSHARRLAQAFPVGVASTLEVPGAGHNDIQLWPRYTQSIAAFLGGS